jgi:primary-amine oxidase
LDEPDKPTILSWLSNPASKPPPRRASVITRVEKKSHEITVDLSTRSIVYDNVYLGHGYPLLTLDEQSAATELLETYEPFIKSIEKRGLKLSEVVCSTYTTGWYGEAKSKRVLKLQCYYKEGTVNFYMRPVEGMLLVVDLDEMKIVEYYDRSIAPVPKAEGTDYQASTQKPPFGTHLNGATFFQPDGRGFKIDGHIIRS